MELFSERSDKKRGKELVPYIPKSQTLFSLTPSKESL